jgi:hypothetical protein
MVEQSGYPAALVLMSVAIRVCSNKLGQITLKPPDIGERGYATRSAIQNHGLSLNNPAKSRLYHSAEQPRLLRISLRHLSFLDLTKLQVPF